jgi:hypothetical protein
MAHSKLTVRIIDEVGSRILTVELPVDAEMRQLAPMLAKKLGLPEEQNGEQLAYHLQHKRWGRRLEALRPWQALASRKMMCCASCMSRGQAHSHRFGTMPSQRIGKPCKGGEQWQAIN